MKHRHQRREDLHQQLGQRREGIDIIQHPQDHDDDTPQQHPPQGLGHGHKQ